MDVRPGVVYFCAATTADAVTPDDKQDPYIPPGWSIKVDGHRTSHHYTALGPKGRYGDWPLYSDALTTCIDEARRDHQRACANEELEALIDQVESSNPRRRT